MDEKDIKRLKRIELLEILYEQQKQLEQLQKENLMLKKAYHQKQIVMQQVGSIANASLALTDIFEEAQKAADIYLESIKSIYEKATEGKGIPDLSIPDKLITTQKGRHSSKANEQITLKRRTRQSVSERKIQNQL
ncbi:MAG: hypothetical protein IIZ64_01760 [Erysipelotrichaceae bacterium]|nr:hypothetical protein [Erysipelotrichaceae bacterium]MBQ1533525.1 hypothetical protein [Erysipelotrichaceae bacterium]